jgi:CUB domain
VPSVCVCVCVCLRLPLLPFLSFLHAAAYPGFCNGLLTADHAYYNTINYPGAYRSNFVCTWTIRVDPRYRINLRVMDFDLDTTSCSDTYLEVFDFAWPAAWFSLGK